MDKIRVRFAPSPTGYLHVGGLRTALYNYLFAKKNGGTFVLRIEDTDQKRFVEGAVEKLQDTLKMMDLGWNEGPYIQSERLEIYKKYADQLIKDDKAYYCFCTSERLEEVKKAKMSAKEAPMYDGHCLNLSEDEIKSNLDSGKPYVVRLKVEKNKEVEFEDAVRGNVKFSTDTIDDQVLLKSDGFPTYHLASVVDDFEMKITDVIRGEEWLPSTPKHILLYEAFGWTAPKFAHLPLLLNPDHSKLSKRQGDVSVEDFLAKGYLKEALINFIALLGWNPGKGSTQEIFSLSELVEVFDLANVNKSGAVFDLQKLDWMNAQYIKKLSVDELYELSQDFWKQKEFYISWNMEHGTWSNEEKENYLKKVLTIEQDRLATLAGVGESNKFFFQYIKADKELLRWKNMSDEDLKKSLEDSKNILENISESDWTRENLEKLLLEKAGDKRGDLLWPLRASLSGEQKSPSPFELAWVLGKVESLKRLNNAIGSI
jgi:glutamyl-tRNA synthetase